MISFLFVGISIWRIIMMNCRRYFIFLYAKLCRVVLLIFLRGFSMLIVYCLIRKKQILFTTISFLNLIRSTKFNINAHLWLGILMMWRIAKFSVHIVGKTRLLFTVELRKNIFVRTARKGCMHLRRLRFRKKWKSRLQSINLRRSIEQIVYLCVIFTDKDTNYIV